MAVGADKEKGHEGIYARLQQEVIRCMVGMYRIESQRYCFKEQVQNREVLSKKSLDSCNSLLCLALNCYTHHRLR